MELKKERDEKNAIENDYSKSKDIVSGIHHDVYICTAYSRDIFHGAGRDLKGASEGATNQKRYREAHAAEGGQAYAIVDMDVFVPVVLSDS